MNVFVFNGSYRSKNSTGENLSDHIRSEMQKRFDDLFYVYRSGQNSDIGICIGCEKCFYGGKCYIEDDISDIKNEMLESDIIIFISPVFVHNVSGIMKVYIDRISSWTHQMRMAGKLGIIISVSDNNGNSYVNEYLKKIMNYFGVAVIQELSITNENYKDSELNMAARALVQNIKNCIDYQLIEINSSQEKVYQSYKILYEKKLLPPSDLDYFFQQDYFLVDSFYKEFLSRCTILKGEQNEYID